LEEKSKVYLPRLVFATLVFFAFRCVLEAFEVLLKFDQDLGVVRPSMLAYYLACVFGVFSFLVWTFLTWKSLRKLRTFKISHEDYNALVYFCTTSAVAICGFWVNAHFKATTWPHANEGCLVGYVFIQLGASVFITGKYLIRISSVYSMELSAKLILIVNLLLVTYRKQESGRNRIISISSS